MHDIIMVSYLAAAVAFAVACVWLASGWRRRRSSVLLILVMAVSACWGALMAWGEWRQMLAPHWLLLAETLRYGAWLAFLSALFGTWPMSGVLRGLRAATQALWVLLALYCVLPVTGLASRLGLPFDAGVLFIGMLLLALMGVVFVEQILRNAGADQRWTLKFLLIPLFALFAYDIFLYSYAVLYHGFDASAFAARGFVNAVLVPVLLVGAVRKRRWAPSMEVSRRVVFYSTSLLVVACYIIAVAVGGYYVRLYGGSLGRVAEIALICFALLIALLVASSGQARSRLRMFVQRNFFRLRHDYREQWLRLTATLAASDSDIGLPERAVRALAQIMDSPAGALFVHGEGDRFVMRASWNVAVPPGLTLAATDPVFELLRVHQWIYDLGDVAVVDGERLPAPTELVALAHAWLLVPLVLDGRLVGFVVLAQARARRGIDWEDIALLQTAGSQIAGTLMQAANAERLAEARQFEGFNRLTAFLMHDLKNVAAQQSLLLQNAQRHKRNPAFVDDMLVTLDNSVRRLTRLLNQLRGDVAVVTHGRTNLTLVIDKAIGACRAQAPMPRRVVADAPVWVQADAEQLAMALEHLLRNAQDAAKADGHVGLRLEQVGGYATIIIEDDGEGMDEAFIRDRLFKPFFTTKASRGMGIGAYQAREYVCSLGGTLDVASTLGHGSVFTLRLPLAGDVAGVDERELAS